jgi:uncharacterized membrane protein YagU involved in acid resistance
MTIIQFPRHRLHRCDTYACFTCIAGLSECVVCWGAENSLPTHCPGRQMTTEEQLLVNMGSLDYDYRRGWFRLSRAVR